MKILNKCKITNVLILVAGGLPLAAQAATEATVNITATVAQVLEVAVDKAAVSFSGNKWQDDVVITTSHNTGAATNITIQNDTGENDSFNLLSGNNTLPVKATIKEDPAARFTPAHQIVHVLGANENNKKTTLHLEAKPGATQAVGQYSGSLVVTIKKS